MIDHFDVEGRLPNVIALMLLDRKIDADEMQAMFDRGGMLYIKDLGDDILQVNIGLRGEFMEVGTFPRSALRTPPQG